MRRTTLLLLTIMFLYPMTAWAQQLPPEGIQAEDSGQWEQALLIYRAELAIAPRRVDLWLRRSDVEARLGLKASAAESLQKAARLEPNNGHILFLLSKAYAQADQPVSALTAIEQAVKLDPVNVDYLRANAQLANWNTQYKRARDCYRRVLAITPDDDQSLLGLARSEAWSGEYDESAVNYREYTRRHSDAGEAYIEWARVESFRGNYSGAIEVLQEYHDRLGATERYYQEKARILAWAARPGDALAIISDRLETDPDNYELRVAHTVALANSQRPRAAMTSLDTLARLNPDRPETESLRQYVKTPLRPLIRPSFSYYRDSDNLSIFQEALTGEYSYKPELRLRFQMQADQLSAATGSGLDRINGAETARHFQGSIGLDYRLSAHLSLSGAAGAASTSRGEIPTYQIGTEIRFTDQINVKLSREYRYYLVSPRTLDLGIKRGANRLELQWRPTIDYNLDASFSYDRLSDGNRRWEVAVAPRRAVLRRENFNLDLGVSTALLGFARNLNNGYYDPDLYQRYLFVAYGYWKITDNDGVSIIAALGAQKDNLQPGFRPGGNAAVEGTFGIYRDWMLKVRGGFFYNGRQASGAFRASSLEFSLTRRF